MWCVCVCGVCVCVWCVHGLVCVCLVCIYICMCWCVCVYACVGVRVYVVCLYICWCVWQGIWGGAGGFLCANWKCLEKAKCYVITCTTLQINGKVEYCNKFHLWVPYKPFVHHTLNQDCTWCIHSTYAQAFVCVCEFLSFPKLVLYGVMASLLLFGEPSREKLCKQFLSHLFQAPTPGDNSTRTIIETPKYTQVVIYDHITRRKT